MASSPLFPLKPLQHAVRRLPWITFPLGTSRSSSSSKVTRADLSSRELTCAQPSLHGFHPPAVKTRVRPQSILNTNWFPYLSLFPRDTSPYPAVLFEHPLFSCRAAGYRLYSRLACCLACPSDIWTPAWFTSSLQTLRYSERHADKHTCPRVTVDLPGLNHNLAQGRVMMWLVPHTGFWCSFALISQCQWRLFCFDVLGKGCPISTASLVLSLPRCLRLQERALLCCSGTLKNSTKDWTTPAAPDDLIKG